MLIETRLPEEVDRDDQIEVERQKLLKKLSIDSLLDALSCAESSQLADCVTLYKSGDTMLLGLAVREIIDAYVEQAARLA